MADTTNMPNSGDAFDVLTGTFSGHLNHAELSEGTNATHIPAGKIEGPIVP